MQPKKRVKPASFPRLKIQPVLRRQKTYTIRVETPVGLAAKAIKCEHTDSVDITANVNGSCWCSRNDAGKLKLTFQHIKDEANHALDLLESQHQPLNNA